MAGLLSTIANGWSAEPASDTAPWALRPLLRVHPPSSLKGQSWIRTPVDAFVLARLEQEQLSPSPETSRRALLRRVHFDLIGLPPTPDEMRRFESDRSPQAYENVVDRLLASPRYGERWARHWMDTVHFAETHGNDQDRIRTNAWPYRDYLIQSFNADKPYARFVREQVAGDVLFPDDPQSTVALGFLAAGPWDESSLRDIREETTDRQIARYLDRDDIVSTVMQTFTSTTVQCARCHDHKFDPISAEDYYSLQAVFAGVDRADRAYDDDSAIHGRRQSLLKQRRALERKDTGFMAGLLEPEIQDEVNAWESAQSSNVVAWSLMTPTASISSNGAALTIESDGSVFSGGTRPEIDTYSVTVRPNPARITAIRIEILADERLPMKGPGRQDNGNLHLSEFSLWLQPALGDARRLALGNATADFNQDGWTIAHALDGKQKTAWGIFPQVGKTHQAVFELKEPIEVTAETRLAVLLEQNHGGGHLIGRVRLSSTDAPPPVRLNSWPESFATILAMPASRRSEAQRIELAAHYLKDRIARELAAMPKPRRVYAAASDFVPDGGLVPAKAPRLVQVLKRGDINRPGGEALPGSLTCVSNLPSRFAIEDPHNEGARRAALANWIIDPENPLAWRSIVNRVWRYHFGRGLVDTPNDFGVMGGRPSHPELLDWLALHFRDSGGWLKSLHRLLVTSAVYRQDSGVSGMNSRQRANMEKARQSDADNRWLWRMNRVRLDAESIRDAILQISGQLDLRMGGPSDQQFALAPGIHVTPLVDYAKFDPDSDAGRRRSIYRFLFRTLPDPFMDSMDCPAGDQLAATRTDSVTALQALSMLNNVFVVRQSERLASRVELEFPAVPDRVGAVFELAYGRRPSGSEKSRLIKFLQQHGLANLCRVVFNSNEFMFVN
jgi:hypothetical protein